MTGRPLTPSWPRPARRWPSRLLLAASFLPLLLGATCSKDDEETYEQFNADNDALTISVGAADLGEAETIDLHSTTGAVLIGTEHVITVEIFDAYQDMVDQVTVRTDSGERGEDEYELIGDSADEGYYKRTLVSVGAEDEVRTDTLTIRVWDLVDSGTDTGG